jgi:hypothetical protein
MTQRLLKLGVLVTLPLLACGGDNVLSGSLSEVFALDVSRTEVRRNDNALQFTYLRNRGVFLDVVVRVAVAIDDVEMKPGVRIDLAGTTDAGVLRTTVVHAPGGEPVRNLPIVKRGDMIIYEGGNIDEMTKGNFSMLFESEGGDLGQGRTLVGRFAGEAKDAGYGEPCPPCLP